MLMKHITDIIEAMTHETVARDFGEYSGKVFLPTRIKYEEDAFLVHTENETKVTEGVIKTYPSRTALKMVVTNLISKNKIVPLSLYGLYQSNQTLNKSQILNHLNFYLTQSEFSNDLVNTIRDAFLGCGYDLGATWTANKDGKRVQIMQFEPLFPTDKSVVIGRYLYHITTKSAYEKIKQKGFVPSNKCKLEKFTYTGRCYFFVDNDERSMVAYIKQSLKVPFSQNDLGCVILRIDTSKIPSVRFFGDPNMIDNNAVFTYENIHPSLVELVKNI